VFLFNGEAAAHRAQRKAAEKAIEASCWPYKQFIILQREQNSLNEFIGQRGRFCINSCTASWTIDAKMQERQN